MNLALSFSLRLISVFNPSISYRGVLTGSSHCGPAGPPAHVCVCVCVSACKCEPQIGKETADTRAEPAVVHTYARQSESLIYSTTYFIESAPSLRLWCDRLPPQISCMLRLHHALAALVPQKHTLVHMQAFLVTMQGHATSASAPHTPDLFTHGPVSNETTLFIVWRDSSGLTIRLIMSHWDIDGCLSILVFTKEPVPLLWVAVDTSVSC